MATVLRQHLIAALICGLACVWHAAAQGDALPARPSGVSADPRYLFVPDASVTAASSISPRNFEGSVPVLTAASASGGPPTPVFGVVNINRELLTSAPRRLPLNLPRGTKVTAIRRSDLTKLANSVRVTPMTQLAAAQRQGVAAEGAAAMWVGEIVGARKGLSSVVLILSEDDGIYGWIRWLDRTLGQIRTFKVSPMVLDGADPVAAATMPDFESPTPGITLASLYPRLHPTKHIILEYKEGDPQELSPEQEAQTIYRGPPEAANAKPVTVDTRLDPNSPLTEPILVTSDVATLAASIAEAAGPEAAAAMGPEGFTAAAVSTIARAQAATVATPVPVATPVSVAAVDDTPAAGSAPIAGAIGGRRMQQVSNPANNTRQDIVVLYTDYATQRLPSGVKNIENAIRARIVDTNKAYADSGVPIDLILLGIQRTTGTSSTDVSTALNQMNASPTPSWVATPRDTFGADFVQLWIGTSATSGVCGIAYVPVSKTNVPPLYSVMNSICFTGYGVTHEIGHNQGCSHSSSQVNGDVPAYAAGWRRCDLGSNNFNTIMEYTCSGGSKRIGFLSNPALTSSNVPAGDKINGHCARRVAETALATSKAREAIVGANVVFGTLRSQVSTAKCVDAWKFYPGTQTTINDCIAANSPLANRIAYQRWQRQPDGSFMAPSTLRCLAATNSSTLFSVYIDACSGYIDQGWWTDRLNRVHPYVNPARCLTVPNSNIANGQVLEVRDCINTSPTPPNQVWNPSVAALFPNPFNPQNNSLQSPLAAAPNQRCIEDLDFNTTDGAPLGMMPCNTDSRTNLNQKWSLTDDGQLRLMFNSNKCMQAVGTGANGDRIRLFACANTPNQRWFMDSLARLRPYHAPTKCLDIINGSTLERAALQLFDCRDVSQQKWNVV